jgi:hypothetical protein
MKKIILLLLAILFFFSCARKFDISSAFKKGMPAGMQQLVLDSSYHLYIREVFLDTSDAADKMVLANNNDLSPSNKLIEIEYLLLSEQQQRVVYISTIPDKYQSYYAKKSRYLKREYLNAYDFSTFRFGKTTAGGQAIVFDDKNDRESDTWNYKIENDSILHVYEVVESSRGNRANCYSADEAFSRKASFVRMDSFRIAFRNMAKEKKVEIKKGRPPLKRFCINNTIYFKKEGGKYSIYFRFDKTLPPRYKDSAISFGNTRLVNAPF